MIAIYCLIGMSIAEYSNYKEPKILSLQVVDIQTGDTNGAKYSFIEYRDYDATPHRPGDKVYTTYKFGGLVDAKKAEVTQWYYQSPLFFGLVDSDVKVVEE